jgi:hypothetical protein
MSERAPFLLRTNRVPGQLFESEEYWRDHQQWLASCGYMLRPRYAPDWVPSWKGTKKIWLYCEDGCGAGASTLLYVAPQALILLQNPTLLDATRIVDGEFVFLKIVNKSVHPFEAEIGCFFSSEALANDPHNHCVPIYEVLQVPDDDEKIILVMPLLREYCDPRFDTVGEVVEFFRQVFEVRNFVNVSESCFASPAGPAIHS